MSMYLHNGGVLEETMNRIGRLRSEKPRKEAW